MYLQEPPCGDGASSSVNFLHFLLHRQMNIYLRLGSSRFMSILYYAIQIRDYPILYHGAKKSKWRKAQIKGPVLLVNSLKGRSIYSRRAQCHTTYEHSSFGRMKCMYSFTGLLMVADLLTSTAWARTLRCAEKNLVDVLVPAKTCNKN